MRNLFRLESFGTRKAACWSMLWELAPFTDMTDFYDTTLRSTVIYMCWGKHGSHLLHVGAVSYFNIIMVPGQQFYQDVGLCEARGEGYCIDSVTLDVGIRTWSFIATEGGKTY